ncbi:MAG TPA: type II toxin-antitoxin system RelE/ParE family toxin [Gammaproteobacteria bacterium]
MRVRLSDEAKACLRSIHSHVVKDSPINADALIDRLTRRAESIGDLPWSGRRVPEYEENNVREILERPYRIIYRVLADEIQIASVVHYRQLLPDNLPNRH